MLLWFPFSRRPGEKMGKKTGQEVMVEEEVGNSGLGGCYVLKNVKNDFA